MSDTTKKVKAGWGKTFGLIGIYVLIAWACDILLMFTVPSGGQSALQASGDLNSISPGEILFLTVVMAPLMEETIFRFIIFNGSRWIFRRLGGVFSSSPQVATVAAWLAIGLSAFLFALAHEETILGLFAMRFTFGVLAAHLYMKTGRFTSNVLLHALHNSLPFLIGLLALSLGHG